MAAQMAQHKLHTLYTYPLAYAPFKAALVLHEKNVRYAPRVVDLFSGDSLSPWFMRLNPASTVPVLELPDGRTIADSKAIVEHVNDGLGDGGPLGGAAADQALAQRWLDRIATWDGNLFVAAQGDPSAAALLGRLSAFRRRFAEARAKENPDLQAAYAAKLAAMEAADALPKDAAAVEANRAELVALLDDAEAQLGKTPFLAGDAYSVADVAFTPVLFRIGMAGRTGEYLEPRPRVGDYYGRVKQRPSFEAAFGAARSKWTLARLLLPALAKAQAAAWTGWY